MLLNIFKIRPRNKIKSSWKVLSLLFAVSTAQWLASTVCSAEFN